MDEFRVPPRKPTGGINPPKLDSWNSEKPVIDKLSVNNELPPVNRTQTLSEDTTIKRPDYHINPSNHNGRKKKLVISGVVLGLALIGAAVFWFVIKSDKPIQTPTVKKPSSQTVKSKPVSPLTGMEVSDVSLTKRPVTGIMIENSPNARPQSGLKEAGIVFEAIAEAGITRFLALYQEAQPDYIGPVRSARSYYLDFNLSFDASYAHVGGSPESLNEIKSLPVKDLDQFFNAGAYWRISERYAPHNMYTSFERLDKLNKAKGYTSSKFTPIARKKDVPQTPTASAIDFAISSPLYSPRYQYDPTSNAYLRFMGGTAHNDQKSGSQIAPKVVIALVMSYGNSSNGYNSEYTTSGSGKMYVFQDGIVSEGTWHKADRKSSFELKDKNGLPMRLNAGQAWISVVGSAGNVTYRP